MRGCRTCSRFLSLLLSPGVEFENSGARSVWPLTEKSFLKTFIYLSYGFVYVCGYTRVPRMSRSEDNLQGLVLSTMGVLEIEFRSSDLVTRAMSISPAP